MARRPVAWSQAQARYQARSYPSRMAIYRSHEWFPSFGNAAPDAVAAPGELMPLNMRRHMEGQPGAGELGVAARMSAELGANALELFVFRAAARPDRAAIWRGTLQGDRGEMPALVAFFAGTIGFGGEVNGMPMSGEWFRLPDDTAEAAWTAPLVAPVTATGGPDTRIARCGSGGDGAEWVVPFDDPDGNEGEPWGTVRCCVPGSVMDPLGRLLDGEWLKVVERDGVYCADVPLGSYRGTPSRPAGPPWSAGGSSIAFASAAALAATALAVARKGRK